MLSLVADVARTNFADSAAILLKCWLSMYAPAPTAIIPAAAQPTGPIPASIGANCATVVAAPNAAVTCGGAPAMPATIVAAPNAPVALPETFPTFSLRIPRFFFLICFSVMVVGCFLPSASSSGSNSK